MIPSQAAFHAPPADLQALPQWVCWRSEQRGSKRTKVPYDPRSGRRAESNNPATWASYQQALAAWKKQPKRYEGVGFMFNGDITGIDLDHCIDAQGVIEPWAQSILDQLASYSERSPSETGLHILVRGCIAKGIRRSVPKHWGARQPGAAIEMYCRGRYFTITGMHLAGTPKSVESRQDALSTLYASLSRADGPGSQSEEETPPQEHEAGERLSDEALLEKAMQAGNGTKFRALYQQGASGYRSASEADLALCLLLAFWTGRDQHQMDRLFRHSALSRKKWDSRRGGTTYGEETIRKALAACTVVYDPQRSCKQMDHDLSSSGEQPPNLMGANGHGGRGDHDERTEQGGHRPGLPTIIVGRQSREVEAEMLSALVLSEREQPSLFVQSGRLVRLGKTERGRPLITALSEAALRGKLTRSADFFRLKEKAEHLVQVPVAPPKDCIENILSLPPTDWPFPALEAIVETPVIRPDGTILDQAGYDEATRLYYAPVAGMQEYRVPLSPTEQEVMQARRLIWETIGEFPYASQADRANALALLFTPILRPAIAGPVPLALLDAPKPGTGKTLFADLVSLIATGGHIAALTAPESEEEWSKSITSLLMEGATVICIDNIAGRLQSAKLDAVLTCPDMWKDRLLGLNRMIQVPQRATWLATGNNIKLGGDLPRRCYSIRLDPQMSRPWERDQFTHKDLSSWVKEHRGELVQALLILARSWFAAGRPEAATPALGNFKPWSRMVGSILAHVGEQGFLENLSRIYQLADEEGAEWETFLRSWYAIWGEQWITTSTITSFLEKEITEDVAGSVMRLPANREELQLPEWLEVARKEKPTSFTIRLGKALEKRVDECFGEENLRLERQQNRHAKQKLWRVVRVVRVVIPTDLSFEFSADSHKNQDFFARVERETLPALPAKPCEEMPSNGSVSGTNTTYQSAGSVEQLPATLPANPSPTNQEDQGCTTRWEHRRTIPHQCEGTVYAAGCWWCERCAPQRLWMCYGERQSYPEVSLPDLGFKVVAGRDPWLRFAQEAGYELIQSTLARIQHPGEQDQQPKKEQEPS